MKVWYASFNAIIYDNTALSIIPGQHPLQSFIDIIPEQHWLLHLRIAAKLRGGESIAWNMLACTSFEVQSIF